jgi:hypothetical protein
MSSMLHPMQAYVMPLPQAALLGCLAGICSHVITCGSAATLGDRSSLHNHEVSHIMPSKAPPSLCFHTQGHTHACLPFGFASRVVLQPFCMEGSGSCCPNDGGSAAPGAAPGATAAAAAAPAGGGVMSGLSWLDRLLPVWIVAAMVLGVLLGSLAPQVTHTM